MTRSTASARGRDNSKTKPRYEVPALDKGLDVLELLASSSRPQTLADMARELGRTSSELFRMVGTLERRDYIVRDATTAAYRLSMKLYEMSHTHSPVENLVAAARGPMRELADSARESCHLSVLERGRLVVVAEEASAEQVRLSVEVGSTTSALGSASGRVLLAHLRPPDLADFLARDEEYQSLSQRKQAALRGELKRIRDDGYLIAPSRYRFVTDVAAIVGAPDVGVIACLNIPRLAGGVNDGKEQQLRKGLERCAAQIAAALRLSSVRADSVPADSTSPPV